MVNEQGRESRGTLFCLKQDKPLINFCKFLNTSVHCLKKRHKEISVLNPLCSDSIRVKPLIEFQEGEWPLLKSWLWLSKKLEHSFKKHRTRSTVGLEWLQSCGSRKNWIWLCWFIISQLSVLRSITSIVVSLTALMRREKQAKPVVLYFSCKTFQGFESKTKRENPF